MTHQVEAQENLKVQPIEQPSDALVNSLSVADWQSVIASTKSAVETQATSSLNFNNDIYGLNKGSETLTTDVKALGEMTKGSAAYKQEMAKIDGDETVLRQDVFALKKDAPDFKSFEGVMQGEHSTLKADANTLWKQGLKSDAGDTTAYYPLGNYAKEFEKRGSGSGNSGSGSGDKIPPPAGSASYNNLDVTANQFVNTIASQIGGSGNIQSDSVTQSGPDKIDYSAKGGAWGDILWRSDIKSAQADNASKIQLNDTFSLTASQLQNTHEIEKDIVFQRPDKTFGILGSQINSQTGEVDFWNTQKSQWVDEGSLGPIEAGKQYDLQIGASINDTGNANTGTYNYDYYELNGVKLDAKQNMFNTKAMNWTSGVYVQTQLDFGNVKKGSVTGMTDSNEQVNVA
ncbi:MAG: hypothetical protein KGS72_14105 [Cyanobacteria bacterium REEB67]|nr:hypothetical protein [Cyanobacteria bacterium REEB67]